MSCEAEKTAFQDAMEIIQAELKDEMAGIATATAESSKTLSDEFKDANEAGTVVGAVAGTAIGGALGGPVGAAAGKVIGETVGALINVYVDEQLVKFSLDVPEFFVSDQDWFFDVPEVTIKDTDIIFNVPTVVMKTVEGPPIPETIVEMAMECIDLGPLGKACTDVPHTTIRWKKTYLDIPTVENREQRIVLGLPEVTMKTQKVVVGVPQVKMQTQEFSFSVPSITIKFTKDASEELAEKAKTIASDAAILLAQKQASLKDRMRQKLVGPAHKMFDCHRNSLVAKRAESSAFFDKQLETMGNSIVTMKSNGVPEGDDDLLALQREVADLIAKRDQQLKVFDDGLAALDTAAQKAIEGLGA